jgi:hypothetical protein
MNEVKEYFRKIASKGDADVKDVLSQRLWYTIDESIPIKLYLKNTIGKLIFEKGFNPIVSYSGDILRPQDVRLTLGDVRRHYKGEIKIPSFRPIEDIYIKINLNSSFNTFEEYEDALNLIVVHLILYLFSDRLVSDKTRERMFMCLYKALYGREIKTLISPLADVYFFTPSFYMENNVKKSLRREEAVVDENGKTVVDLMKLKDETFVFLKRK